jgi:hypothetical protein
MDQLNVVTNPENPGENELILDRINRLMSQRPVQKQYAEPNFNRGPEDRKTKKRNKIAAQSRKRNRRK